MSFFYTPKFLSTSLHIMTCFEIPVHIFGAYIILWKTPESMKSVKWNLLNAHFWCMALDLTISLLTTPFIIFPAIAGYPLGLFTNLGVSTPTQIYIGVSIFAIVGISVLGVFENRFFALYAQNSFWKWLRVHFFVLNYIMCVLFFIPPYLDVPEQKQALEKVYEELSDSHTNLPSYIKNGPVFVLTTDATYSFISVFLVTIFIIAEILVFILALKYNTYRLARTMTLSKSTMDMQKKFLHAIHIQMYTPLLILIPPLIYIACSIYFRYHNQALNNLCFVMISLHGLASTIVMVLIHKPYREASIGIFCARMNHNKTTPMIESRRPSSDPR